MKDCNEVRLFVHCTWREYKQCRIPLTVAAMTMNSAIEIYRRLNDTFLVDYPEFEDHREIIAFLNAGYFSAYSLNKAAREAAATTHSINGARLSSHAFVCEATTKTYFEAWILPWQMESRAKSVYRFDEDDETNQDKQTARGEMHLMLRLFTLLGLHVTTKIGYKKAFPTAIT
jgi:hypothetical protein